MPPPPPTPHVAPVEARCPVASVVTHWELARPVESRLRSGISASVRGPLLPVPPVSPPIMSADAGTLQHTSTSTRSSSRNRRLTVSPQPPTQSHHWHQHGYTATGLVPLSPCQAISIHPLQSRLTLSVGHHL